MRRIVWVALAGVVALIAAAAATAIGGGAGTEEVGASFDARAVGDPHIKLCADGRGGKFVVFEANYAGMLRTARGEEFAITLRGVEVVADPVTGLGAGEGNWRLQAPPEPDFVARGELTAVFIGDPNVIGDPGIIGDPHLFEGELHGMLVGFEDPDEDGVEDPDERQILWNVAASLRGETATGAIGNPNIAPNPAVLVPQKPKRC